MIVHCPDCDRVMPIDERYYCVDCYFYVCLDCKEQHQHQESEED